MRLSTLHVNNFKSLVDFRIELAKFTCLIGLNGAGKSTVVQFVDFLGRLVHGDIGGWLKELGWKPKHLLSEVSKEPKMEFFASLTKDDGTEADAVKWKATFDVESLQCAAEEISTPTTLLRVRDGRLRIEDRGGGTSPLEFQIAFKYQGSILSRLTPGTLRTYSLDGFRSYFLRIKSLGLLAPEHLRERVREGTLARGGRGLASALNDMSEDRRLQLTSRLRVAYPRLQQLVATELPSGRKQVEFVEEFDGGLIRTEARHVNDGLLRLLAVFAALGNPDGKFLLFDEIENGFNPELIQLLVDALVATPKQVVATTHSPMILNYIDDAVAKDAVVYLYKNERGATRAIPFFSIPSLAKKLTVMGPGEAYVDTNLVELADEIAAGSKEGT